MSSLKRTRSKTDLSDSLTQTKESNEAKEARLPKRKVAVMIGYCGTGYHGMQLNYPHKTIEGDLFDAFCKAGAISKDNSNDPKKSSLIRAARTDKGVHAAGNVISLKLIVEDPDIVTKINSHLPDQIRVWGISRTNKSFECRKCCSSRVYEYLLPTYTLMTPKPRTALGKRVKPQTAVLEEEAHKFWTEVDEALKEAGFTDEQIEELEARGEEESTEERDQLRKIKAVENTVRRNYRAAPERLALLQDALDQYKGVHNFHNFTVGQDFHNPSSTRIMKSLSVSVPTIIDGTEWVSIKIHGQSFMLHQIRKMIAFAALVVRTGSPSDRISGLFGRVKVGVPKAPALGLLLEQPVYDGYNIRLRQLGHPEISFEKYTAEMDEFKQKHIYDKIHAQEAKENEFHAFFAYMDAAQQSKVIDYLIDGVKPVESAAVSSTGAATGAATTATVVDDEAVVDADESDAEAANEENEG